MLSIKHLSKSYVAVKPVLTDIDLEITEHGITAIIGPSGTGKSTLVRCINRLVALDPKTSVEIMQLLADIARQRGIPVLINMHDGELARCFADRIVGMAGAG